MIFQDPMTERNAKFQANLSIGLLGVAVVLVAGCAHPVAKKLDGRWYGEAVENFEEEDIAVATGWVRGTTFEFAGSTITVSIPADDPRRGSYEVASARQGRVLLSIHDDAGGHYEARLSFDDADRLRWHLDDTRDVLLRREF